MGDRKTGRVRISEPEPRPLRLVVNWSEPQLSPAALAMVSHRLGNRDWTRLAEGLIVEDGAARTQPGQMARSEFLAALRTAVHTVADQGLARAGRDSIGCPAIAFSFGWMQGRPAAQIEKAIRRWAPEVAGAYSAAEVIQLVSERVRVAVDRWVTAGEFAGVPEEVAAHPNVLPDAEMRADVVRRQLGPGRLLPADLRARMEPAFDANFSGVRIHDGEAAVTRLDANALTIGDDVAFAPGKYRPATPGGDALLAHELAHVKQQQSAGSAGEADLEADADRAAAGYIAGRWLGLRQTTYGAVPRLRSGLRLARCSSKKTDQHAGTEIPNAAKLARLQAELHPTAVSSSGVPLTWDGASTAGVVDAAAAAKRLALKSDLLDAMKKHLDDVMPTINVTASARRLPMTSFEGPGNAAKKVTDEKFNPWISVAALTPSQATLRHGFTFQGSGPGQNLFDAYDPAQRTATGHPIDPRDLASWISETDEKAVKVKSDHNFDPTRGGEEETFLNDEILDPFVTANLTNLKKYDQFGFAISGEKIVAPSSVDVTKSDTPGPKGEPSPAERAAKWQMWELLVHEYIHTLAHPAFNSATGGGNRIMVEGFCEMFTKEVLKPAIPKAPKDAAIRQLVEGGDYGAPPHGIVPNYSPGQYEGYLKHAENIRDNVLGGRGGDNSVKAAFFQGHVEFIGLTPTGAAITPVDKKDSDLVTVPAGFATVTDLAAAAQVREAAIFRANPGLKLGDPLPSKLHVPGAREHIVVVARATGEERAETREQIAAQNGVSVDDLSRANPAVHWTSLTEGQRILIPNH